MDRRAFLKCAALAAPWMLGGAGAGRAEGAQELAADLVIIGGGLGGCAAALAAARHGLKVIMTEETDWIGGQITQQAVPPDENQWIETFGASRSYQEFRAGIREYYRRHYPLTPQARAAADLNPGRVLGVAVGGGAARGAGGVAGNAGAVCERRAGEDFVAAQGGGGGVEGGSRGGDCCA